MNLTRFPSTPCAPSGERLSRLLDRLTAAQASTDREIVAATAAHDEASRYRDLVRAGSRNLCSAAQAEDLESAEAQWNHVSKALLGWHAAEERVALQIARIERARDVVGRIKAAILEHESLGTEGGA